MERDAVIAHGLAGFLKESFMERADKFRIPIGNESGAIVVGNPDKGLYMYDDKYLNPEDVSEIQCPYAQKLLLQELISMGINIQIKTQEEDI